MASAAQGTESDKEKPRSETNEMDEIKEFVKIGRTGRRNAVADVITDSNLNISTLDITELMQKINCNTSNDNSNNNNNNNNNENSDETNFKQT